MGVLLEPHGLIIKFDYGFVHSSYLPGRIGQMRLSRVKLSK